MLDNVTVERNKRCVDPILFSLSKSGKVGGSGRAMGLRQGRGGFAPERAPLTRHCAKREAVTNIWRARWAWRFTKHWSRTERCSCPATAWMSAGADANAWKTSASTSPHSPAVNRSPAPAWLGVCADPIWAARWGVDCCLVSKNWAGPSPQAKDARLFSAGWGDRRLRQNFWVRRWRTQQ